MQNGNAGYLIEKFLEMSRWQVEKIKPHGVLLAVHTAATELAWGREPRSLCSKRLLGARHHASAFTHAVVKASYLYTSFYLSHRRVLVVGNKFR